MSALAFDCESDDQIEVISDGFLGGSEFGEDVQQRSLELREGVAL